MKTVYLLLTRSTTIFSVIIRIVTAAPYTHISISLSDDPNSFDREDKNGFFSFGRKNPRRLFPAGFIRENRAGGYFQLFPKTHCILLALPVPDDAYNAIRTRLRAMTYTPYLYRYNLLGALLCGLGIIHEKKQGYFCSQFVGDLLSRSGAVHLPKHACLMHPIDYMSLEGITVLYTGSVGELLSGKTVPEAVFHYSA